MTIQRLSTLLFILATSCAAQCLNAAEEESKPSAATLTQPRPMSLTMMLSLLPTCPDTWVMKRSQAQTLYQGNLEAYAMREFEEFALPIAQRPKNAPKPETVVMVIRDTCGRGPHIAPFLEDTAPTSGGDFKLGNWDRYPAMLVRMSKNRRALRVLVADRYVVEVVFSGSNLRPLKWWLGRCNLKGLAKTKQHSQITVQDNVNLYFLDQVHPERTRHYSVPVDSEKPDDSAVASRQDKTQETASK
jgi:hypothetical protein